MLPHALKEWAVICKALASGRQSLLLRKGGIAEAGDSFMPGKPRFWLYPTYTHQQENALKPEAALLLEETEQERPPTGVVRLTHYAVAAGIYHVHELFAVLLLDHLHLWSEEAVRARFAYRQPGIYVVAVRIYRAPAQFELREIPAYAGCRSWLELERGLPTEGSQPVLVDADFQHLIETLDRVLKPIGLA
jgi:hypothetical protein